QLKGIVVATVISPEAAANGTSNGFVFAVIRDGGCSLYLKDLPDEVKNPKVVGARFRATGILAPVHNSQRQATGARVVVSRVEDFEVLEKGTEDIAKLPISPIAEIGPAETDYSKPVVKRIFGTVTAVTSPHSFFLQDDSSGLHVRSFTQPIERPGRSLELLGVMQKIGDTEVFTVGFQVDKGEVPLPMPVAITQSNLGDIQKRHMRGRLEATVLHSRVHQQGVSRVRAIKKGPKFEAVVDPIVDIGPRSNEKTFEMALKFGSSVIYAHVPESIMDERAFEVGSNVRVTGTLDSFIIPESGYQGTTLYPVQAKDLEYLTGPPTSPTEFLLMGLGLACGLAAVVIGWNLSLRYRVRNRTLELAREKERLLDSEARYRRLADNSFDVIWTMDLNGNYTYLSPSVERTRGYTPEEFMQLPREKVYSPESLHLFDRAMAEGRKRIEAGLPVFFHNEMSGPRKDGSVVWTDVKATTVRDSEGKFVEILGVTREITQRKLAEEELQKSELRYRSLTEASSQAVWRTDGLGNPLKDMPSWLAYTGMTWEELQKKGWFEAVHPDDRAAVQATVEKGLREGRFVDSEYRLRRHDGEYRIMEVRGVPMRDAKGTIVEWIGTCTDITDRKRAQEVVQTALREKEILLKEIHHRVKNNLQTITALLDMQAEKLENREAWEALRESRGRVRSMSLIHERLYRTQD
ncbi:MAG: PAS domain S-box protein, partial [Gemmataceae bacterium]